MSALTTRRLAIGAAALFTLACNGGDAIVAVPATVDGVYALSTINGTALPVTLVDTINGVQAQFTFMAPTMFTLKTDKTYLVVATIRFVFGSINEIQTDSGSGTYSIVGQQVSFVQAGATAFTGTWNGSNMLTIAQEGDVFVFKK